MDARSAVGVRIARLRGDMGCRNRGRVPPLRRRRRRRTVVERWIVGPGLESAMGTREVVGDRPFSHSRLGRSPVSVAICPCERVSMVPWQQELTLADADKANFRWRTMWRLAYYPLETHLDEALQQH